MKMGSCSKVDKCTLYKIQKVPSLRLHKTEECSRYSFSKRQKHHKENSFLLFLFIHRSLSEDKEKTNRTWTVPSSLSNCWTAASTLLKYESVKQLEVVAPNDLSKYNYTLWDTWFNRVNTALVKLEASHQPQNTSRGHFTLVVSVDSLTSLNADRIEDKQT